MDKTVYILEDRKIRVEWTILKGTSPVREDFRRALVKVFLIGNCEKYLLEATADRGTLMIDIPEGLEPGLYSLEAIWVKNAGHPGRHDRDLCRSMKQDLFAITEFEEEATNLPEGTVVLKAKSSTATYGYDGLSSYELAVLRGEWNGTEGEWLKHQRYVSVLDGRGDSEVDTMSQKSITEELVKHDTAIEDTNKEIDTAQTDIKNLNDEMDEVQDRLAYIPKESFLSSEPACDYHTEDNQDELTVSRAIKDRFGRIIDEHYVTRETVKDYTQEVVDGSKLEIQPGSVQPEDLSPAVQQMIESAAAQPGHITNLPDEEDLTVTEHNTLQFKDREYNPYNYSGMGKVYLRKHIVNGTNILAQHMMTKPNTIYVIRYDYCLAGETIEVPEGCVLEFDGGTLRNGTIVGNNTKIKAETTKIFDLSIDISGSFSINCIYPEWFGALSHGGNNATVYIQKSIFLSSLLLVPVKLVSTNYYISNTLYFTSYASLEGNVNGSYSSDLEPTIVANFGEIGDNKTFAWIFDTNSISTTTGERLKYNAIEPENSINENIYYNACRCISVKNIRIDAKNKIFGGIRLFGSPNSKLESIYIQGTKIAIGIFVSWAIAVRNVVSSTYLCGGFVNECQAIEFDNVYMDGYRTTNSDGKYVINYEVIDEDYFEDFITFVKDSNTHNLEIYVENYKHGNGLIAVDCRNLLLNQCLFEHWATGINLNRVLQSSINNYYVEDIWYIGIRANQSTIGINGAYQVGDANKVPNNIIYLFDIGIGTYCTLMGYRFRSPNTWNTNIYTPNETSSLYEHRGTLIILGNGYRDYSNWILDNPGVTIYDDINSMMVSRDNVGFLKPSDYVRIPQIYENGTNGFFYYRIGTCNVSQRIVSFVTGSLRNGDSFIINISAYQERNNVIHTTGILTTSYGTPDEVINLPKAYYVRDDDDSNIIHIYISIDSGCSLYVLSNNIKSQRSILQSPTEIELKYIYSDIVYNKSGSTEDRPIVINAATEYFDTTLNKPIWWTGSKWVDATGAEV